MLAVLIYEADQASVTRAPGLFPAHRARLTEFHDRGELLLVGPWKQPHFGAMAVFTTVAAAEAFANDDPFVLGGVVTAWHIRQWDETYSESASAED